MKRTKLFTIFLFSFFVFFSMFSITTHAQKASVTITPDIPGPNSEVSVSLSSYLFDLNNSSISWTLDGKEITDSKNKTNVSFVTGDVGTRHSLKVTVSSANEPTFSITETMYIGEVDLFWEAFSTVPSIYKGKALWGKQVDGKIIANPNLIINGRKIPNSELSYDWRLNNNRTGNLSGMGKDTLPINSSIVSGQSNITLEVSHISSGARAYSTVNISHVPPSVILYEDRPLQGIMYNNALTNITEGRKEIKMISEPFFFSLGDSLNYEWKIDGVSTFVGSDNSITLGNSSEDSNSSSLISVLVKNISKGLQSTGNQIRLILTP